MTKYADVNLSRADAAFLVRVLREQMNAATEPHVKAIARAMLNRVLKTGLLDMAEAA